MSAAVVELWVRCPECDCAGEVEGERVTWRDTSGRTDSVVEMVRCEPCQGWGVVAASQAWAMRRGRAP